MPKDREDFEIGFGKPPSHTQFKKGQSGNPKGRPEGSKSLATTFNELAGEKMWVNTPKGRKRMSLIEMGIMQLLTRSAKGEPRAIREVIQMKKTFGDVVPEQAAPIFQVHFVKSKHREIEMPRIEAPKEPISDEKNDIEEAEDEEEYYDPEGPYVEA